ncbi:hypothetical protein V501_10460 [Pseudogymnoascus sp. VKM F-4519 (FW-2642)]|nr:hypothetical protein V501_10460 [Pseudogymnoascus sp. VKM F-4519 (FW-2642)]
MAGNLTSPFQGLNANVPPRVVTALSREQFLYSLARTPSPARFQRPRSNGQILSGLNNTFQTRDIRDGAIDYPHNVPSAYRFNPVEGPNSEPAGENPVRQLNQILDGANKRQYLIPNEAVTNFQRLAPEAKSGSTLRAAQIPTPTSERKTAEELDKTDVASVELGEYSTSLDLGDESGYDSNGSSGEESASLYTNTDVPLSGSNESDHATIQLIRVGCLDSNPRIRKPSPSQQDESSVINGSPSVTDTDQTSPRPSKKRLKRPTRTAPKTLAQDDALETIQEEIPENIVPERICRTSDQLQLTEERVVQGSNSESGDFLFHDDSSIIESQHIVPETPLLSIRQKRFPETSPQMPRKKRKKTYSNTKMMSSRIHFKDLTLISRASEPPNCPKPIPTRLDFCDGFVGEEFQPIGHMKATSRPRRLPRPGVLRRLKGYSCQLPLVQSRTFGDKPSLQEGNWDFKERVDIQFGREHVAGDSSHGQKEQQNSTSYLKQGAPIISQPTVWHKKPKGQMSDANPENIAGYKTPSIIDVDMDVDPNPQSEESDNGSSFSDSLQLETSPKATTFKRSVTFNEDVEVIRQQLSMVSAPLPTSTTSSDDESDEDHINEDDDNTHSEGSDSHASESGSEVGSSADEHSIEPSSPQHDRRPLNVTLPSTPIRRWIPTEASASSSGGEADAEMLDDEMILDDTASMVPKRYQVSDAVHLWGESYDDEMINLSPSCPWAPRRPNIARHSIEVDQGIFASPSSRVPRQKTVNNIRLNQIQMRLNQSQMDWSPTQPATPIPHSERSHREPSIELGDTDWPPRSFFSQSMADSQASGVMHHGHQSRQFMVADVPSYFCAASQNFNQPPYRSTAPAMRSKSMPLRSQYFEKYGQDWNAEGNMLSNLVPERKVASFMGSQDERNISLRALTRHISIGFGTPGERRRNPLLPFRPPLKHI